MASLRNALILHHRNILKPRNPESSVTVSKRWVMDKTQWNKPYSYGYSKFAHDQPEEISRIRKWWMVFVSVGIVSCFLDWGRFAPILEKKIGDVAVFLGFKRLGKLTEDGKSAILEPLFQEKPASEDKTRRVGNRP